MLAVVLLAIIVHEDSNGDRKLHFHVTGARAPGSLLRSGTAGPRNRSSAGVMTSPQARTFVEVLDPSGDWLLGATRLASPNCDDRPAGCAIDLVVVHGISLPPGRFGTGRVADLFLNCLHWDAHDYFLKIKGLKVSSHLLLERNGGLTQFVPFGRRAWHAGESSFMGRPRCNDFSIGIELEGTDELAYEDIQYQRLAAVIRALMARYPGIGPGHVVGHCDVAPGRKTDPGPAFDWSLFAELLGPSRSVTQGSAPS